MKRTYNFEKITTFSEGDEPSPFHAPLVERLGSFVSDPVSGEVLLERPNAFFANDRIGFASFEEEAGKPVIVDFSSARDLKSRALSLVKANHVASIFNDDAEEDDEDKMMDDVDKHTDADVDLFNNAMQSTPYAVGEDGLAHFERVLAKNKKDLKNLRKFMELKDSFSEAFKDHQDFDKLMALSPEELNKLISGVASQKSGTGQVADDATQTLQSEE